MEYPYFKQEGRVTMSSYFKMLKSLSSDVIYPAFYDLLRSGPDALFLGTGLLAMLTQSFPLAVYTLAMAEFGILHQVFSGFVGMLQDNTGKVASDICTPGLPSPLQISPVGRLLAQSAFPSGVIFFMTASIIYSLSSIQNFKQELDELGNKESEWKTRIPLSYTFGLLFIFAFVLYRILNDCDGVLAGLSSVLFGALAGFIVYILHVYLFGRDSVNFLGIPLLADRAANGKPLYVCAKNE
jgi:hypothetical protein